MIFALLCYLLAIAMSGAWRPDGAVPRLRPPALFEPGANPLSAAERPAAARGLEAAAEEGSPMADSFASTSAPASASGAKVLRGSLDVEEQSQGKFARSSVPAPRRAASEAKATSGVDVAAPRSENEDSADDDGFEPRRERTHPSAPASAVEDLLVREGSLGGGGRQLGDTAEDRHPSFYQVDDYFSNDYWSDYYRDKDDYFYNDYGESYSYSYSYSYTSSRPSPLPSITHAPTFAPTRTPYELAPTAFCALQGDVSSGDRRDRDLRRLLQQRQMRALRRRHLLGRGRRPVYEVRRGQVLGGGRERVRELLRGVLFRSGRERVLNLRD